MALAQVMASDLETWQLSLSSTIASASYSGRSEYMFIDSVKDNETHRIYNIATTNTIQKASEAKVGIVTLTELAPLKIFLMLIQLLQKLLNP